MWCEGRAYDCCTICGVEGPKFHHLQDKDIAHSFEGGELFNVRGEVVGALMLQPLGTALTCRTKISRFPLKVTNAPNGKS